MAVLNRLVPCFVALFSLANSVLAAESLWIEAEHLTGVRGYCWPMGRPEMKQTAGHWGLSGPGWAAEWCQGGESGFLSIATGADDDKASASTTVEIPETGTYFVWVRYGDWREKTERFQIHIEQPGKPAWTGSYVLRETNGNCPGIPGFPQILRSRPDERCRLG